MACKTGTREFVRRFTHLPVCGLVDSRVAREAVWLALLPFLSLALMAFVGSALVGVIFCHLGVLHSEPKATLPALKPPAPAMATKGPSARWRRSHRASASSQQCAGDARPRFRVLTYNVRFVISRWRERIPQLTKLVESCEPDLIAMQEICCGGSTAVGSFCSFLSLEEYSASSHSATTASFVALAPTCVRFDVVLRFPPVAAILDLYCKLNETLFDFVWGPHIHLLNTNDFVGFPVYALMGTMWSLGNALAIRKKPSEHHARTVALGIPETRSLVPSSLRSSSKVLVAVGTGEEVTRIWFVNVHLADGAAQSSLRSLQIEELVEWVQQGEEVSDGVIICGDFNMTPYEPGYRALVETHGYRSAHHEAFGREPNMTFSTAIESCCKDLDPDECLDYVFFKGSLALARASGGASSPVSLVGGVPSEQDPSLFPSDHLGVVCDFVVER